MIAFQVPERITRMLPPSLIGTNGTQAAVKPLVLIDAKKDTINLTRPTIVVVECFAACHFAHQGLLGDTVNEDLWQQCNGGWIATTRNESNLHLCDICVECRGRTRLLAVA